MAVSKKAIKEALTKAGGIHAQAAQALGVDRSTISKRVARDPDLKAHCDDLINTVSDIAKSVVISAMNDAAKPNADAETKRDGRRVSMWWLERRDPDFAHKHAGPGGGGIPLKLDLEGLLDGLDEDQLRALNALRSLAGQVANAGRGPGAGLGAAESAGSEDQGTGET